MITKCFNRETKLFNVKSYANQFFLESKLKFIKCVDFIKIPKNSFYFLIF